jgi:hypothetical protein
MAIFASMVAAFAACGNNPGPAPVPDAGGPCITGQRVCKDLQIPQHCERGQFVDDAACGSGQACSNGLCRPVICMAGEGMCGANNTFGKCNAAGTSFDFSPCPGDTVCSSMGCKGRECTVGARRCKPGSATGTQVCSETGAEWLEGDDCGGESTGKVCLDGQCEFLCRIITQVKSSLGCEYWAVDLDNAFVPDGMGGFLDAAGAQFALIVSNTHPQFAARVTVDTGETSMVAEAQVAPSSLHVFNLPRRDVHGTTKDALAYRVRSSIPIVAYQFNPLDNVGVFSNDASLLLPNTSVGKSYVVMTRAQDHDVLRTFITVVATRPGMTEVYVKPAARVGGGPGITAMNAGDEMRTTLAQYEVLNLETDEVGQDLTGSIIIADKEVAVFGGSQASNVPSRPSPDADVVCCADHLEMQMFSEDTWGFRYVAARFKARGAENDYWRILAKEDGTRILTLPHQITIPMLNRGQWFEFDSPDDFEILADRPILVGQFMASSGMVDPNWRPGQPRIGDPAFSLAVAEEQWRKDYVFLVPLFYEENFVNIIKKATGEVTLDGVKLDNRAFTPVGQGTYQVLRLPILEGTHRLSANEPVSIIVYGYSRDVSYAYPGGLNLEPIRR